MGRLKERVVKLFVPLAPVIVLATLLTAQGPPNPCANACWQAYLNAVHACHGNAACLAEARAKVEACVQGCGLMH